MNYKVLNKERITLIERFKYGMEYLNLDNKDLFNTTIDKVNRNLFYPLQENEIKQFENADGNELETKAYKVNSSAALLLNVFTPLRKGEIVELKGFGEFDSYEFETKLQVLNGKGRKANIDMSLVNEQSYVYIESKFTELFYYREKSPSSPSYQDRERYPSDDIFNAAIQFIDKYKYYDANQLLKHTIGIYRDCLYNPSKYSGKKVYLLNLNWELLTSDDDLKESFGFQLRVLKESTLFIIKFNKVMKKVFKKIGIDFQFIYINYYDLYKRVLKANKIDYKLNNYINVRYFNIQRRGFKIDDAIDYIEYHLDDGSNNLFFRDMIKKYNIIHIEEYSTGFGNKIYLKEDFGKDLNAVITIEFVDKKLPVFVKDYKLDEYLNIHSSRYYNKRTVIYLSKVLPKNEETILI